LPPPQWRSRGDRELSPQAHRGGAKGDGKGRAGQSSYNEIFVESNWTSRMKI